MIPVKFGPRPATSTNSALRATTLRKFGLIKDAGYDRYYDVIVEVAKKFFKYDFVDVYVTDYTSNSLLYDYPSPDEADDDVTREGDPFQYTSDFMPVKKHEWPGPYGTLTLKVEVLEPHASVIKNDVEEGDFIIITNMRVKMSNQNRMEANVWRDNKFPNKIQICKVVDKDDPRVKELQKRKDQYWHGRPRFNSNHSEKQLSKGQKKRQKEKAKRAAVADAEGPKTKRAKLTHGKSEEILAANKHISCISTPDLQVSSLSDMINTDRTVTDSSGNERTLPFIIQRRKVQVRVVDYFPSRLEDFAEFVHQSQPRSCDLDDMDQSPPIQGWKWHFKLLIEQANLPPDAADAERCQMWVTVDHQAAEFLLPTLDAAESVFRHIYRLFGCSMRLDANISHSLTTDTKTLAQLREALAILWGNLEERKSKALEAGLPYPPEASKSSDKTQTALVDPGLSNLPVECCIREYGAQVFKDDKTELIPMFGLCGIVIRWN